MVKFYKKLVLASLALLASLPATEAGAQTAEKGQTFYGYRIDQLKKDADGYSTTPEVGWVTFNTSDTAKVTLLKKMSASYDSPRIAAGEYLDGKLYTYSYQYDISDYDEAYISTTYDVYDAETFKVLKTVNREGDRRVSDMTFDPTTHTMYALAENKVSSYREIEATSLNIVNLETGTLTPVGSTGEILAVNGYGRVVDDNLVTLACDGEGNLYAMSAYRHFYKVDKFTGKVTEIGKEHKLAVESFFQSMTFGADGVLYWAQHTPHPYGWLTTIDTATGVPTKIGKLGEDDKLTCLFQKRNDNTAFPLPVTGLKGVNDEEKHHQVTLSWTLPVKNFDGTDTQVTEVRVYRLGTPEAIAVLPGNATQYVDDNSGNGDISYEVVPVNGSVVGQPATVTLFAGYDQLKGVTNLHAVLDKTSNTVSLSWDKPTGTVNNLYSDFDNIVYNVYRVDVVAKTYVRLSENQPERTFEEKLSGEGIYSYVVEAVSGGAIGLGAQTENVTIYETKVPPYTAKFEKLGDGLFWTAVNAAHKYGAGWSISSYKDSDFDGYYARLYKASANDPLDDWFLSPPISLEKGQYNLTYSGKCSDSDKCSWEVMLGTDDNDLTTFTRQLDRHVDEIVYGQKNVQGGWTKVCDKNFTVETPGIYYLGLYGFTQQGSYFSLCLDNLSITPVTDGIGSVRQQPVNVRYANGAVEVNSDKAIASWRVFNAAGQPVMGGQGNGTGHEQIGMSALPAGLYLVSVTTADGATATQKIKK